MEANNLSLNQMKDFLGNWIGKSISFSLKSNGIATLKIGNDMFNRNVTGKIRIIPNRKLIVRFSLFSLSARITKMPFFTNSKWFMELNGKLLEKVNPLSSILNDTDIMKKLVLTSISNLNQSMITNDFGFFYNKIAKLWKTQITAQKLSEAFQGLIDQHIILTDYINKEIAFSKEPIINENNFLCLEGYFASDPMLKFILSFTYEHPSWEVVGISIGFI